MKKVCSAKKYIIWFLTVACMVAIFAFSSQNAEESTDTGMNFTVKFLSVFPSFENLTPSEQDTIASNLQFVVRKCAHFSEYACLGILMKLSFMYIPVKKYKSIISAFVCMLYSVSDEIHQYFVPGRSCEIRDMCIDTSGAVFGIAIISSVIFLYNRHKNKKELQ